jgi:hypothetical protein
MCVCILSLYMFSISFLLLCPSIIRLTDFLYFPYRNGIYVFAQKTAISRLEQKPSGPIQLAPFAGVILLACSEI